jgi:cyclophilin family peptidyl-prolyl cis-trans isomerase
LRRSDTLELDLRQRKAFHDLTRSRESILFHGSMRRFLPCILSTFLLVAGVSAQAGTKVRIATPIGNIDLELYDADKPVTVKNFLSYVQSGRYANSFSHRLVTGFVLQSGGYYLNANSVTPVTTDAPIVNEYSTGTIYSNVKGTIAMAKVSNDPNSATSQWFLNLADNGANLDTQNGGFTVFGHVVTGMDVLELFNSSFNSTTGGWGVYNAGGDFTELPLLANSLNTANFIYTPVTILSTPDIALAGPSKLKAAQAMVKVKGTALALVSQLEWRLGTKGAYRKAPAGTTWQLRVPGLKHGVNFLYVRGVSASGVRGKTLKIKITRK